MVKSAKGPGNFSGRAQRAGLETSAGWIRPAGRTLETPALE